MLINTEIHCDAYASSKFALTDENLSTAGKALWLMIVSQEDPQECLCYFLAIDESSPFYEVMKELLEKGYFCVE